AVVPFRSAKSPVWEKVALEDPKFGARMPRGEDPLTQEQIDLIARWIDEGAKEFPIQLDRGDVNADETVNISDAIALLAYLFLAGTEPSCIPAADADANGSLQLTDAIRILTFLFQGAEELTPLTREEHISCNDSPRPPVPEPIGTVFGTEGIVLEFTVRATDPNGDPPRFEIDSGPDGLTIDENSGLATWTPRFGEAGDHRIRVRVIDGAEPALSAVTSGLIRVAEGNRAPRIGLTGPVYGREGVLLSVSLDVTDDEGDSLSYSVDPMPEGLSISEDGVVEWTPAVGQAGEYGLFFEVFDDGVPTQSDHELISFVILAEGSPENNAPRVDGRPVYRTYPNRPIRIPIEAQDPDGNTLTYSATQLPEGSSLDEVTGIFTWTPTEVQLGPFYALFTVTDNGTPPLEVEGRLVFKVLPFDNCTQGACDPEFGCDLTVEPIDSDCCLEDPYARVAEPVVDCPEGRVLFVGRNRRGFGRLQNCDEIEVIPLGQGGTNVQFHLEARCVDTENLLRVRATLNTRDYEVFDAETSARFTMRNDGYAQRLSLSFSSAPGVSPVFLHEQEGLLTVSVEDDQGTIETSLRIRLTLNELPDLPEPDVIDVPAGEAGCVGCHRPTGKDGERHGIEDAHPWFPLTCVDCHGGDAQANTRERAHVAAIVGPSDLKRLTYDELNGTFPPYLQFVNPGDLRVADRGCGSGNPANPGTGCHQSLVDNVKKSVMNTYVGHYKLPRYLAGSQDREATLAAVDIIDELFEPDIAPIGAVGQLAALRGPAPGADRATIETGMDVYLPKACPTCHLSDFGPNDHRGKFRSSGCTACHMQYSDDGLSESEDPTISPDFPSHPVKHALTSAIGVEQCSHCHFQGGRIGLAYRG
ncbi:MAG: putative Ig domain-containing protein, partial [Planctomycetota bacterium]